MARRFKPAHAARLTVSRAIDDAQRAAQSVRARLAQEHTPAHQAPTVCAACRSKFDASQTLRCGDNCGLPHCPVCFGQDLWAICSDVYHVPTEHAVHVRASVWGRGN